MVGDDERLVDRHPVADPVAEPSGDDLGVVGERFGGRATGHPPASSSAWGRSQWYSVGNGRDAVGEQRVDQPVVEVEARLVDGPRPSGCTRGQAIENRYALRPSRCISATSSAQRW